MELLCTCGQERNDLMLSADGVIELIRTQKYGNGDLIEVLFEVQKANGYISEEMLKTVAEHLNVPVSRAYGVVTFYSHFRLSPVGEKIIRVCHGTACYVKGAEQISNALTKELKISEGETTSDGLFTLENVACLGCCSLAPVVTVNEETFGTVTPDSARKIVRGIKKSIKDSEKALSDGDNAEAQNQRGDE